MSKQVKSIRSVIKIAGSNKKVMTSIDIFSLLYVKIF